MMIIQHKLQRTDSTNNVYACDIFSFVDIIDVKF